MADNSQPHERGYLAIIVHQYGGGSYARGDTPEEAAKSAARIFRADWKHLGFGLKPGAEIPVFDVREHDSVSWDDRGVRDDATGQEIPMMTKIAI